jgi:sugar/nucleoside kinase (ribokinase family)
MVLVSPDSERTMHTYLGITAELTDVQIDFTPLKTAKWLYIEGYLSTSETARHAVEQARTIARASDAKIALTLSDPAMVQYARAGLDEMIADGVDLLFCNEQEALMYTETETLEAALVKLQEISQHIVITLSAKGALICNEGQSFTVPGRAVTAVDTNGAGDAFAGAFLYALNTGLGWKVAAELAILISSQVVSQFGPRLAIADYAALLENFQKECA